MNYRKIASVFLAFVLCVQLFALPAEAQEEMPPLKIYFSETGTQAAIETLELDAEGKLWNLSAEIPYIVMENVKEVTPAHRLVWGVDNTWSFMLDRNNTLWTQTTDDAGSAEPVPKVEQVKKYVANNAYDMYRAIKGYGWAMDEANVIYALKSDETVQMQRIDNAADIAGGAYETLFVLKNDGTLWYKLADEAEYVKLSDHVADLFQQDQSGLNVGFVTADNVYHRIRLTWNYSSQKASVWDEVVRQECIYDYGNGFYNQPDGSLWFQYGSTEAVKISDASVKTMSELLFAPYGGSKQAFLYFILDISGQLFCVWQDTAAVEKVADQVTDFDVNWQKNSEGDYHLAGGYLKNDGMMVPFDGTTAISGIKDIGVGYVLNLEGQLFYQGKQIAENVESFEADERSSNLQYQGCIFRKTDGSLWRNLKQTPEVSVKVKEGFYQLGDIDGNGKEYPDNAINANDALLALRHSVKEINLADDAAMAKLDIPAGALKRANVTAAKDPKEPLTQVDASDALQILRYSVKEIDSFV